MNTFRKLSIITLISGSILALILKAVQIFFQVDAYILLFNMDYIPVLRNWEHIVGIGYVFHYAFCFVSIIGLYLLASLFSLEKNRWLYIFVYTSGSALLYFLTALTNQPPDVSSFLDWFWWVLAHIIFGLIVGICIEEWIGKGVNKKE